MKVFILFAYILQRGCITSSSFNMIECILMCSEAFGLEVGGTSNQSLSDACVYV